MSPRLCGAGLLLWGLSWLGYDHYRPWVNFHSEALACAGALLLLGSRLADRRQALELPLVSAWLLVAAGVAWLWWALGIGLFAGDALIVSLYLTAVVAATMTGYGWSRIPGPVAREQVLSAFAAVGLLAAIASAAIGLLQWLVLTSPFGMYVVQTDPGDRAMGNLGQPNQLGTLLLMGMAAALLLYERRRIGRFAMALSIGFLTLVLVMAQSRAGIVGVVAVALFLLAKSARLTRLRRRDVVVWALAFALATALLPQASQALLLGDGRDLAAMGSTSERLSMWRQVVAGIAQAPWWGYGWNQTPTAHAASAAAVSGLSTFSYAHNLVLDLMAWNGLPLGLLWTGLMAYWLGSRLLRARTPAAVAGIAALLPLAIHSQLEFPFAYAYFLVFAGLWIGIVEADHVSARAVALKRRWVGALAVLWATIGVYVCYEYLLIEEDFRIVRFENLRIGQTPAAYEVPEVWMLSHMAEMLKAARVQPTPGMTPDAIERLRKVALRFPWGTLHLRYAGALALNGDARGAEHEMRVIRGMFGEFYYAAAKSALLEQQARYPQAVPLVLP